ncbi:hypothetical protein JCGZ_10212 [Jatropha curcas]|uniref:Small ribosomal subunit protein mS38 n=1 Tax=Jatropha curcas TaxID=180498 RepID=A0A067LDA2_JATCU|nr:hypothetical protein JCGZ_10212 [Jatropha curcas]
MALSTLQKFFKNSPPPSIILASLRNPCINSTNPSPPSIIAPQIQQLNSKPNENQTMNAYKEESLTHFDSSPFSSIHPFGFCSYPILSTGSIQDAPTKNEESGIWADSVKKKRKKKMNKHKYKKLRKRLRRQT